jgi:hypothetical protein
MKPVNQTHDKDEQSLDAITENPTKGEIVPRSKTLNTRLNHPPPTVVPKKSGTSLRSTTSKESLASSSVVRSRESSASREVRARPRPISTTGIPSPRPTRTTSLHSRNDDFARLNEVPPLRRSASIRSVSTSIDAKPQIRHTRPPVPVRELSKPPPQKTVRKPLSKDLSPSPGTQTPTRLPTSSISSRDIRPAAQKTFKQLSSNQPSPSPSSSPKAKTKPTTSRPVESPPDQLRLLQLLHLLPQSTVNLSTYESSAHKSLSSRFNKLQSRFLKIQSQDHANSFLQTLRILQSWSDANIRTLSTLVADWEDITNDITIFIQKMQILKPVNAPVIQEKGSPLQMILMKDRLLSCLHGLDVTLAALPTSADSALRCVMDEMICNLPLLRKEIEMAVSVAGLRWRKEVLQIEVKRMEIVKRMSLGKAAREGVVCAWRE